jgi:4-aminobutyrate aminotransferase-like enzyme
LRVLEVIEREKLADNARDQGAFLKAGLEALAARYPGVIRQVRGLGLMLGFELAPREQIPALAGEDQPAALQVVRRLHEAGVLTVPAGPQVVRLLPPLNLRRAEAEAGLAALGEVLAALA